MHFYYSNRIMEAFPSTAGGIIVARNVKNGASVEEFTTAYRAEQSNVIQRLGSTALSEVPSLSAWRQAFRQFGVNPTKTRCAPEALLRRLTKQGDIPSINTLVDIGNLVSIRYALPVAVFDLRDVQGTIRVDFASGAERFTQLGSDTSLHPDEGEVVFADESDMVVARRWCWRQSAESAARENTTDVLICIEAQHPNNLEDVKNGQADLLSLLEKYAGGDVESALLSTDHGNSF